MPKLIFTLALAGSLPFVSASCNSFTPFQLPNSTNSAGVYTTSDEIIPISDGVTCSAPQGCWYGSQAPFSLATRNYTFYDTLIGGIVTDNRTLNYSASSDTVNSLFSAITAATNLTFSPQLRDNLTGQAGFGALYNTSGYAVFVPQHTCVVGTLDSCSGEGYPANGTVVKACTPTQNGDCTSDGGFGCMAGHIAWENTTRAQAESVYCQACEEEIHLKGGASTMKEPDAVVVLGVVAVVAGLML